LLSFFRRNGEQRISNTPKRDRFNSQVKKESVTVKSYLQKLAVTGALLGCALTTASAQLLYSANGWEPSGSPSWTLNNIPGQNSWLQFSSTFSNPPSPNPPPVTGASHRVAGATTIGSLTINPASGTQMHRSVSPNNSDLPAGMWTWVDLLSQYNGRTAGNNTIIISLDGFLPSTSSASNHQHGIDVYDIDVNRLATLLVQNDAEGVILAGFGDENDGTFGIGSVVPRDEWVHYDLILDYDANSAELFIDGVQFAGVDSTGELLKSVLMSASAPGDFNDADLVSFNDPANPTSSNFFTDNYTVNAVATSVLTGQISLADVGVSDAQGPVLVTFILEDENGEPVNAAYFAKLTANGSDPAIGDYSIRMHGVDPGDYRLYIKGFRHLSRVVDVTVSGGTATVPTVTLLGGDANGDDAVDVLDLDELIQSFDTFDGDPNHIPSTDFNYDGATDVLDLDILIMNFDQFGEGI
jgi:hypothetical protein